MNDPAVVNQCANNIRILSAAMVEKAKSGHPGGAMGGADFINILFTEFLQFNPDNMAWPFRDRFFLDPGHMSAMLYSTLALCGKYSLDDLKSFRQWGSHTPGHPEVDVKRGVENTSGPLGQGHAMGVGAAIAERFLAARFGKWMAHKTVAYISDGGVQEEISQAAGRIAGHLGLANFIMFYDSNDIQLSSETSAVSSENTGMKYKAWGWRVDEIDGNDPVQIRKALKRAWRETERPTLIIGKTVMGKGAVTESGESFERKVATHGMPLGEAGASFEKTMQNLGADPAAPFAIFPEVADHYAKALKKKKRDAARLDKVRKEWEAKNPELSVKLAGFLDGKAPEIDFPAIAQKPGQATRAASATVLAEFAKMIDNMIVSSADLSNSDKTDGFLKNTKALAKGDFSGKFFQAGVSELTMAAIMNGIALHGGVIAACGTFFVFSDYMKPAVRLAALMGLPVKYVWTHDAFRVGEDGPTHQPVEHEAQIRLLEKMNNLEGKRSVLVLRPADSAETTVAWKLALENTHGPTALILSRQNIVDIPAKLNSSRYEDALDASKGAYIVHDTGPQPDLVLVANGSEVSLLIETAKAIEAENNLCVRVVSAISEGLFMEQPEEYRQATIPQNAPVFGVTAGLPVTLAGLVGGRGKVFGMTRFGASAPYKVLDEKFGFTVANIKAEILKYLGEQKST